MDTLILAAASLLSTAPPSLPPSVAQWEPIIQQAASRFVLPAVWIERVMAEESGGQTRLNGQPITSTAGAMGLMQIMPATWRSLRSRYGLGNDPFDPHDNIFAGAAYLRELYERYGYPNLFVAYNAGPGRFDDYVLRGRVLPAAALAYEQQIADGDFASQRGIGASLTTKSASDSVLFFVNRASADAATEPLHDVDSGHSVFVPLSSQQPPSLP